MYIILPFVLQLTASDKAMSQKWPIICILRTIQSTRDSKAQLFGLKASGAT